MTAQSLYSSFLKGGIHRERTDLFHNKGSRVRFKLLLAALLLTPMMTLAASAEVSLAKMKDAWPFTLDKGVLRCESSLVTFSANGKTYAVNGSAKTKGRTAGWTDVREIWKDNPAIPGTKISIGPMITKGLELCK